MLIKESFKNKIYPINHGYDRREKQKKYFGIVVHTTNGKIGSSFQSEFQFLLNSPKVSAHFLISKTGDIWQLLDINLRAWHAGTVNDTQYSNNNSIGIEMHYTPHEEKSIAQINALTDLCKYLIKEYPIAGVKMHREVCVPSFRKIDPSNFTNIEFNAWRNELWTSHK